MDINIIPIGNSKGIRLSKTILEKYQITDSIEMILEEDQIILKPNQLRKGWEKQFKKMHDAGDDSMLIPDVFEDENLEEWS
jgi:antitoxin MazE